MNTSDGSAKAGVVLLSGFLGAGKTTLLKRVLAWETDLSDTVVVVNEFGAVGIDGALLKTAGSDVVELTSGCICCTLSVDLKQSLTNIWNRFHPRRILIESSGVADPTSIITVLQTSDLADCMQLNKVITVLDADFWEGREMFGPLFYNQLESAHLVLFNKVDLVDKDKIPAFLKELHAIIPNARVVPTIQCGIDPETLWAPSQTQGIGLKSIRSFRPLQWGEQHETPESDNDSTADPHGHDHPTESVSASHFVTFVFQEPGKLDENGFNQFIKKLPLEVFRMKGPVCFQDRTIMVNYVGGQIESLPWEETKETQLAFIGWNIDSDQILTQLQQCVIQPE